MTTNMYSTKTYLKYPKESSLLMKHIKTYVSIIKQLKLPGEEMMAAGRKDVLLHSVLHRWDQPVDEGALLKHLLGLERVCRTAHDFHGFIQSDPPYSTPHQRTAQWQ